MLQTNFVVHFQNINVLVLCFDFFRFPVVGKVKEE